MLKLQRASVVNWQAMLVLDRAGWHSSPRLNVPENIVLLPLPPYASELNPKENVWDYMRGNDLSHRVWDGYAAIIAACCTGWNKLMQMPDRIASLTRRSWAKTVVG
jgi:transposase